MTLHKNVCDRNLLLKNQKEYSIMQAGREAEFKAFAEVCSMKTAKCVNVT